MWQVPVLSPIGSTASVAAPWCSGRSLLHSNILVPSHWHRVCAMLFMEKLFSLLSQRWWWWWCLGVISMVIWFWWWLLCRCLAKALLGAGFRPPLMAPIPCRIELSALGRDSYWKRCSKLVISWGGPWKGTDPACMGVCEEFSAGKQEWPSPVAEPWLLERFVNLPAWPTFPWCQQLQCLSWERPRTKGPWSILLSSGSLLPVLSIPGTSPELDTLCWCAGIWCSPFQTATPKNVPGSSSSFLKSDTHHRPTAVAR